LQRNFKGFFIPAGSLGSLGAIRMVPYSDTSSETHFSRCPLFPETLANTELLGNCYFLEADESSFASVFLTAEG